MNDFKMIIITGQSGAGKTQAVRCFEDMGYFCVDNLPPVMMHSFAELCRQSLSKIRRIAVVVDVRGGEFFSELFEALDELARAGYDHRILYLDASDQVLVTRFKETRRKPPLADIRRGVLEGIKAERKRLQGVRDIADNIIDTSGLTARELQAKLECLFSDTLLQERLSITIISFGYKYGIPLDADLLFDVRFLPNPQYVEEMKALTGEDRSVAEYVMKWPVTKRFISRLYSFVDFLLPQYIKEGKAHLTIGIGCTGGQHRAVAISAALCQHLRQKGYRAVLQHRDIMNRLESANFSTALSGNEE